MTSSVALGSPFTAVERAYLDGQHLGRLVTLDRTGRPQVRPVGFTLGAATLAIGGIDLTRTQKFRNIRSNPAVAFVVDDLVSVDPWQVRGIEIRGTADAVDDDDGARIVIHPRRIVTWGLRDGEPLRARDV
jgi:pyridoxamine 5'-phosphate oxidase family protein